MESPDFDLNKLEKIPEEEGLMAFFGTLFTTEDMMPPMTLSVLASLSFSLNTSSMILEYFLTFAFLRIVTDVKFWKLTSIHF